MTSEQVIQMKPLVLAYIGDSVYEQYVRAYLITKPYKNVHDLHKKATAFVKAGAQAEILLHLQAELTPKETDIVRMESGCEDISLTGIADTARHGFGTLKERYCVPSGCPGDTKETDGERIQFFLFCPAAQFE